jgi:metal-responsive CopG/Arc/MetJ family transcriptional regulator
MLEIHVVKAYFSDMKAVMTRITVSVPVEVAARLDAAARATDRTASEIVRLALRIALLPEDQETPMPEDDQHGGMLHPIVRAASVAQRETQIQRERVEIQRAQQARVAQSNADYLRQLDSK